MDASWEFHGVSGAAWSPDSTAMRLERRQRQRDVLARIHEAIDDTSDRSCEDLAALLAIAPVDLTSSLPGGGTLVHAAAASGDPRKLTMVLSCGPLPTLLDSTVPSPLHIAAFNQSTPMVAALMEARVPAPPLIVELAGISISLTPLHLAAMTHNAPADATPGVACLDALLLAGIPLHDAHVEPLALACQCLNEAAVSRLLQADIDASAPAAGAAADRYREALLGLPRARLLGDLLLGAQIAARRVARASAAAATSAPAHSGAATVAVDPSVIAERVVAAMVPWLRRPHQHNAVGAATAATAGAGADAPATLPSLPLPRATGHAAGPGGRRPLQVQTSVGAFGSESLNALLSPTSPHVGGGGAVAAAGTAAVALPRQAARVFASSPLAGAGTGGPSSRRCAPASPTAKASLSAGGAAGRGPADSSQAPTSGAHEQPAGLQPQAMREAAMRAIARTLLFAQQPASHVHALAVEACRIGMEALCLPLVEEARAALGHSESPAPVALASQADAAAAVCHGLHTTLPEAVVQALSTASGTAALLAALGLDDCWGAAQPCDHSNDSQPSGSATALRSGPALTALRLLVDGPGSSAAVADAGAEDSDEVRQHKARSIHTRLIAAAACTFVVERCGCARHLLRMWTGAPAAAASTTGNGAPSSMPTTTTAAAPEANATGASSAAAAAAGAPRAPAASAAPTPAVAKAVADAALERMSALAAGTSHSHAVGSVLECAVFAPHPRAWDGHPALTAALAWVENVAVEKGVPQPHDGCTLPLVVAACIQRCIADGCRDW